MCTLFTNNHVNFEATEHLEVIIEVLVLTSETQNSQYHILEKILIPINPLKRLCIHTNRIRLYNYLFHHLL